MKRNNIAVIPARGGSKSIPKKNIKSFEGKPLIAWTIEAALNARNIDRVIVSTDDPEIFEVAKEYGAEVPFIRPEHLCTDDCAIEPVLRHCIEWLQENENYTVDSLILLFATNPLRKVSYIEESIDLFHKENLDTVLSVNESPAHYTPYWTIVKDDSGHVSHFDGTELKDGYTRRQDFPRQCYAKNDQVFVVNPANLLSDACTLYGDKIRLYEVDKIYDGDINDEGDWHQVLATFRYLKTLQDN